MDENGWLRTGITALAMICLTYQSWSICFGARRPKKVIVLSGLARSGKDTLARCIVDARNELVSCRTIAFADPLREVCSIAFGIPLEDFTHDRRKDAVVGEWGITPRQSLVWVGTELFRNQVHPDIWIRATLSRIAKATEDVVIVTDARFENEITQLEVRFGAKHVFKVSVIRQDQAVPSLPMAHTSEHFAIRNATPGASTFPFDLVVIHDGKTFESLRHAAKEIWARLAQPA